MVGMTLPYSKSKRHKGLGCWSWDMFNFDSLEKPLGLVSSPQSVYNFSRKIFLVLYSIIWQNFIVWLPSLIEILGNMCVEGFCFPIYNVLKLILPLLSRRFFFFNFQKSKIKIFIIFKGLSVARNGLRYELGPLQLFFFTCW